MGVEDEGLGMTIADADDGGKEGRGSDSSVSPGGPKLFRALASGP